MNYKYSTVSTSSLGTVMDILQDPQYELVTLDTVVRVEKDPASIDTRRIESLYYTIIFREEGQYEKKPVEKSLTAYDIRAAAAANKDCPNSPLINKLIKQLGL